VIHKETFEMRSLNLDQLRTLIEVIEQGSYSAAARRLNLTQPAVSLQVRELERRFGVQLIERLGRQT
jgi:DNA-binding transcriptional LysR family regulator